MSAVSFKVGSVLASPAVISRFASQVFYACLLMKLSSVVHLAYIAHKIGVVTHA